MNFNVIGSYPTVLNDTELFSYICVLLMIADVDGISDSEMELIEELSAKSNVSKEQLNKCLSSYKDFDLSDLPDYSKQWACCVLRDAILIADCDNGISSDELSYLKTISSYSDLENSFKKILDITLSQKKSAEAWEDLLSN